MSNTSNRSQPIEITIEWGNLDAMVILATVWFYLVFVLLVLRYMVLRYMLVSSLWPSDAIWWQEKDTHKYVNIGSGNGLLPDGTKPLPEPMLTYHQLGSVSFIREQLHKRYLSHQSLKQLAWTWLIYNLIQISQGSMG